MRVVGKRISKGSMILFISFTAIALCLLLIVSAVRTDKNTTMGQKRLYSECHRDFTVLSSEDENQWESVVPALEASHDNFAIYVSVDDPEMIINGICVDGKVERPPMINGRYFDYESSWTDTPKAVVGKNHEGDVLEEGGKCYYDYNGVKFEVIGVMGTKNESRLNSMIIMDFKSAIKFSGINTKYVLDAKNTDKLIDVGSDIFDLFTLPASVMIILEKGNTKPLVARLLAGDVIMDTLYVLILVSFSLSTVLVTFIWLRYRRQLFYAWSLCGYKRSAECIEISKRYFVVALSGFVCGTILMGIVSAFVPEVPMEMSDVLKAFGITVGLGSVILYGCYFTRKE